ncbi:hypothetical protein D9757_000576 [Collybiopsis confluens]|uniref:Uncharacterized protein n=1 Tax=Collybiopsis confluens TaxID=2823264 RepID=A0A8H5I1I6_9AGAR|nr:hypothetical protein D9757_000576 [Collybiopsis confluens]
MLWYIIPANSSGKIALPVVIPHVILADSPFPILMGLLDYFYPSKTLIDDQERPKSVETNADEMSLTLAAPAPENTPLPLSPMTSTAEITKPSAKYPARRFSFKPKPFTSSSHHDEDKPTLSAIKEKEKRVHAANALSKRLISSNSDKRAKQSALLVRGLIVGPTSSSPKVSPVVAKPQMNKKLKSQLMEPKSATKIISHLRQLSADAEDTQPAGPIHAVCLNYTETEMHEKHLSNVPVTEQETALTFSIMNNAHLGAITSMFNELHIVDLVKAPDFGLGQPGDGDGILAGAIPTAETVINGIEQVTPQLMALGYATGRAIFPDHTGSFDVNIQSNSPLITYGIGIHPPTDRLSVLTYWWGFEVVLPPPSLVYLANAQSVSGSVLNFLTALAVVNNGVREILPFVRYISQFIEFEFKTIQGANRGKGVVCAATWLVPAALVPRAWDFSPPEADSSAPVPASGLPASPLEGSEGELDKPIEEIAPSDNPSESTSTLSTEPSKPVALAPSIPAALVATDTAAPSATEPSCTMPTPGVASS